MKWTNLVSGSKTLLTSAGVKVFSGLEGGYGCRLPKSVAFSKNVSMIILVRIMRAYELQIFCLKFIVLFSGSRLRARRVLLWPISLKYDIGADNLI